MSPAAIGRVVAVHDIVHPVGRRLGEHGPRMLSVAEQASKHQPRGAAFVGLAAREAKQMNLTVA